MKAGKLRCRVSFVPIDAPEDGMGGFVDGEGTPQYMWASITDKLQPEFYEDRHTKGMVTHIVTVRTPDPSWDASFPMRGGKIKYGSRSFTILGMANKDNKNYKRTLLCSELWSGT